MVCTVRSRNLMICTFLFVSGLTLGLFISHFGYLRPHNIFSIEFDTHHEGNGTEQPKQAEGTETSDDNSTTLSKAIQERDFEIISLKKHLESMKIDQASEVERAKAANNNTLLVKMIQDRDYEIMSLKKRLESKVIKQQSELPSDALRTPPTFRLTPPQSPVEDSVACEDNGYCLGRNCDLSCQNIDSTEKITHLGGEDGERQVVNVEKNRCHFVYPKSCSIMCKCVNRTSRFKSEQSREACTPCAFRKVGWLTLEERNKCAPEFCPSFFPQSCGMTIISAKHIADLLQTDLKGGIWISLVGDSVLRQVFLNAASFLAIRSQLGSPYRNVIRVETRNTGHYICCDSHYIEGKGNEVDNCEFHVHNLTARNISLPDTVAEDILARKRIAVPICVSWQWNTRGSLETVGPLFAEFESTYARTGIRPATLSMNPGLLTLHQGLEFEKTISQFEEVRDKCTSFLAVPPGGGPRTLVSPPMLAADSGRTCILITTSLTAYSRDGPVKLVHGMHYTNILAYNTALSAVWLASSTGLPLIDAGTLTRLPYVHNSIISDGVHYSQENAFNEIVLQMILQTSLRRGAQICELEDQQAPVDNVPGLASTFAAPPLPGM